MNTGVGNGGKVECIVGMGYPVLGHCERRLSHVMHCTSGNPQVNINTLYCAF